MNKKNICITFISIAVVIAALILILFKEKITNNDEEVNENIKNSDNANTSNISDTINKSVNYDEEDLIYEYDINTKINIENNNITVNGAGVSVENNVITINEAGAYSLSGNIEDGSLIIDVDKDSVVKVLFDNVVINSNYTSPVYVKKVKKCILTIKEGTTSTLSDTSNYIYNEVGQDEPRATIYSKGDLVINGKGILNIEANYNDAISTNDAVRIFNSNININSIDDSIRGKDYVYIKDSSLKIESEGDAIKSTNEDSDKVGFIILENSNIEMVSTNDGIDAATSVYINGGKYSINTGGSSSNASTKTDWGNWSNKGFNAIDQNEENDESAKGIKAKNNIEIDNGTFILDTSDDSIHSNNIITINNGEYDIKSGDDGIHSDTKLTVNNGSIKLSKSYEGLESTNINLNGGDIDITASDDGINVAGGNDMSSLNGRPGQNNFNMNPRKEFRMEQNIEGSNESLLEYSLTINGGSIIISADGDGLDSNGNIYINAGNIRVFGPTNDGNGALDYAGECIVKAGDFVAIGSSGMMQALSNNSTQNSIAYRFDKDYNAGSIISIKDSSNNEILSIGAEKKFSSIVFSNNNIKNDEIYKILIDGKEISTIQTTGVVTSNFSQDNMLGGMEKNQMPNSNVQKRY